MRKRTSEYREHEHYILPTMQIKVLPLGFLAPLMTMTFQKNVEDEKENGLCGEFRIFFFFAFVLLKMTATSPDPEQTPLNTKVRAQSTLDFGVCVCVCLQQMQFEFLR